MSLREKTDSRIIPLKNEYYTPACITDALGAFDLDPCAPLYQHRHIAEREFTLNEDGLKRPLVGRVWCNPPFTHPECRKFVEKMAAHGDGILLLPNHSFDSAWFQDYIFDKASAIIFLRGRIVFDRSPGVKSGNRAPTGHILVAYGVWNAERLKESGLEGKFVWL